jgi:prepilin-type processing-associated H-X9-DG protein
MQVQENSLMRKEAEYVQTGGQVPADVNRYEGERDQMGRRHGKGNFFFADGSSYNGEWREGLRHGVG